MNAARSAAAVLAAVLLVIALAACGPGVGGTGTGYGEGPGNAGIEWFSATAGSACTGPQAELLGCSAAQPGSTPQPGEPQQLTGDCALATLEGDRIVVELICSHQVFAGRWGTGADGVGRYFGLMGKDPLAMPSEPATLTLVAQGSQFQLWLHGATGLLLSGPLLVQPPGGAAVPGS